MADRGAEWPHQSDLTLTADEAFDAARIFIDHYWRLRGLPHNEMSDLVGFMARAPDGGPGDPAQWSDWIDAVERRRMLT